MYSMYEFFSVGTNIEVSLMISCCSFIRKFMKNLIHGMRHFQLICLMFGIHPTFSLKYSMNRLTKWEIQKWYEDIHLHIRRGVQDQKLPSSHIFFSRASVCFCSSNSKYWVIRPLRRSIFSSVIPPVAPCEVF